MSFGFSGFAIGIVRSDAASSSSWPLNEYELDYLGASLGWDKVYDLPLQPPMASYQKESIRLNFWLSTGTVGSYLEHPRQGKTQLFRRDISMSDARSVFENPRTHTGAGYHRRQEMPPQEQQRRLPLCLNGVACTRRGCRFYHPHGTQGSHGRGGRGPCRNGQSCTRSDCWFDHPST
jgi:hypothetical protein